MPESLNLEMSKIKCFLFFSILSFASFAQVDTTISYKIVNRILDWQARDKDANFNDGIMKSYRRYALNSHLIKPDNNVFYTALVVYTLNQYIPKLTSYQRKLLFEMNRKAASAFPNFKNQKGRNTYNFWTTKPPKVFPNSGWLNWFDRSKSLPDDMDDTVMILLALLEKKSTVEEVHTLMQGYLNGKKGQINSTIPAYTNFATYSTWFGEKMPIDFDVCVLSNILSFVNAYQLKPTSADSAAIQLIQESMQNRRYVTQASAISTHYQQPAVILYHYARLMKYDSVNFSKFRTQLIDDAQFLLQKSNNVLEQILLMNALMKWGVKPAKTILFESLEELINVVEKNDYPFFVANMSSIFSAKTKSFAEKIKVGTFYYYSPPFNLCLLLEHFILAQRF